MVSVVIPSFNAAETIAETIESVLQQRYPTSSLELVLVDDGSEDQTLAIAKQLIEQSPIAAQFLSSKRNGPSGARNIGWQAAKGDWIQFLDADDLLRPDKIRLQTAAIAADAESVGVYYSAWTELLEQGDTWVASPEVHRPMVDSDPEALVLSHAHFLQIGSQLIRKTALADVGGFDESMRLTEDVDLNARLARAGWQYRLVESEEPLLYFRKPAGYESKYDLEVFLEVILSNADKAYQHWKAQGTLTESRKDVLCDIYQPTARIYSGIDLTRFNEVVDRIYELRPGFVPRNSKMRALLSQLLGYRSAERIAALLRRFRGR